MSQETLPRVLNCLAKVTRYPLHLLTVDADLENDLGIDSVKRVEIVVALSTEFAVDLQGEENDPSIRTIGQIAAWV
ncbi:MAG TPA: short-chain dehydrogenase, partial [Planctomycetaceae bacterium]|nr:short-chain dehydrogenase [Planctomycetaceae bacterium]